MSAILYTSGMVFIDIITMSLLKLKNITFLENSYILPISMILYSIQPLLFFKGLSFEGIGIVNGLWNAISTGIIAVIGFLVFKENLSFLNCLGILLCMIGILLIGFN
jgi:hypothetical protein